MDNTKFYLVHVFIMIMNITTKVFFSTFSSSTHFEVLRPPYENPRVLPKLYLLKY